MKPTYGGKKPLIEMKLTYLNDHIYLESCLIKWSPLMENNPTYGGQKPQIIISVEKTLNEELVEKEKMEIRKPPKKSSPTVK